MLKLIIADDEQKTKDGLITIVPWNDLDVEVAGAASDGAEAYLLAKEVKPDIIITDVKMPRMDGIHFAAEIRKILPLCQIIFISGYSDKEYLKSAISLKAVSYVEKPLDIEELIEAVKTAASTVKEERQRQKLIEKSQSMYEQNSDIISEQIAIELISLSSNYIFLEQLAVYHSHFAETHSYCTLICQLNYITDSGENGQNGYDRIKSALNSCLSSYLLAKKQSNIFIIHLCDQKLQHNESRRLLVNHIYYQIKAAVSDFAQPFLAVGNHVLKIEDIRQSYINAVICLKRLFFMGYNNVSFFQNHDTILEAPFIFDSSMIRTYSLALKAGNREEANAVISRLTHEVRKSENRFEINGIKDIYYQLTMEIAYICEERNIPEVFSQGTDYIWESIAKKDTIFALAEYITGKSSLYFDKIAEKEHLSSIVYTIMQYVGLHFSNQDFSVNNMARHLHFTPAYLCQVFKNETDITINSYITDLRIEKAKELLKSRDRKLTEIAVGVGYSDANYLTRVFKKYVGITPSEFREKYIL